MWHLKFLISGGLQSPYILAAWLASVVLCHPGQSTLCPLTSPHVPLCLQAATSRLAWRPMPNRSAGTRPPALLPRVTTYGHHYMVQWLATVPRERPEPEEQQCRDWRERRREKNRVEHGARESNIKSTPSCMPHTTEYMNLNMHFYRLAAFQKFSTPTRLNDLVQGRIRSQDATLVVTPRILRP